MNQFLAGCWWLTPVILATQEAEIQRIAIQSQPRQIIHKTISKKIYHKKGLVEWLKQTKTKTKKQDPVFI
jgi:hypothetical protein